MKVPDIAISVARHVAGGAKARALQGKILRLRSG